jgi:hypothetical protein
LIFESVQVGQYDFKKFLAIQGQVVLKHRYQASQEPAHNWISEELKTIKKVF